MRKPTKFGSSKDVLMHSTSFNGNLDRFSPDARSLDFKDVPTEVDGRSLNKTYNQVIQDYLKDQQGGVHAEWENATWAQLEEAHQINETASTRCVGLVVETRPDHISPEEIERIRRLGCTKVQIGLQSLQDSVLKLNHRGHDVAASRRALKLIRGAGFKIHAHWMANLYGSSVEEDIKDFERLFNDPDFCPDELKLYPCSLIESAELMQYYQDGRWRPYTQDELAKVLTRCFSIVPEYCRLSRVIRDIPSQDIVVGNKHNNFRETAEKKAHEQGIVCRDIRMREIKAQSVDPDSLSLRPFIYETSISKEVFFQFETKDDRLAGFLRLSLPSPEAPRPEELDESCAMIREVHVYGFAVHLGKLANNKAQHRGLGKRLVNAAADYAREQGYKSLAVISAIGTRKYYSGLGFEDGQLYQYLRL